MAMKGKDKFLRKLKALAHVEKIAGQVVFEGADMIHVEAFRSISRGSVSGKSHVPSAPGEPPNRDTGVLQAHLETEKTGNVTAEFRSEAPYSRALEFGTSKMAVRPHVRPARDKMTPQIRKLFAKRLNEAAKKAGK
jgi:HK97 gp10 family phage protein